MTESVVATTGGRTVITRPAEPTRVRIIIADPRIDTTQSSSGSIRLARAAASEVAIVAPAQNETVVSNNREGQRVVVTGVSPQGPAGPASGNFLQFTFSSPLLCWNIVHNLGRRPVVDLSQLGGCTLVGGVIHLNNNVLQVKFVEPQTGIAVLL